MSDGKRQPQADDFGPTWPEVNEQSQSRQNPKPKFRETSSIPPPSERLHQEADAPGFAARRDATRRDKRAAYRAERTGAKLDAAKQKQAKQRPPKKPGRSSRRGRRYRHRHGGQSTGKFIRRNRKMSG